MNFALNKYQLNKILITGHSGFVGKNWLNYSANLNFKNYKLTRNQSFILKYVNQNRIQIILHFAGKAHDLKKTSISDEYYQVNTDFTKFVFDAFLLSDAKVFVTLSSVKAIADKVEGQLNEDHEPSPASHYGKSKLLAEQFILSKVIPRGKRVYILRPCMIHGPNNKGNLNLLYNLVNLRMPWPLGSFNNRRSFCSIENLCFVIKELIEREDIPSGIYNVADNESLSTIEIIQLIGKTLNKNPIIFNIPKRIIYFIAKIGDVFHLPLNTERLQKLTETYLVSNAKLLRAIGKPLPVTSREGFIHTFKSFNNNA
jgi:nucleoside-diphosphate-sugar epimerase